MSVLLRGRPHVNRAVDSHTFCVIPEAHHHAAQHAEIPRGPAQDRGVGVGWRGVCLASRLRERQIDWAQHGFDDADAQRWWQPFSCC